MRFCRLWYHVHIISQNISMFRPTSSLYIMHSHLSHLYCVIFISDYTPPYFGRSYTTSWRSACKKAIHKNSYLKIWTRFPRCWKRPLRGEPVERVWRGGVSGTDRFKSFLGASDTMWTYRREGWCVTHRHKYVKWENNNRAYQLHL